MPASRPSARFVSSFGEIGVPGTDASWTTVTATAGLPSARSGSIEVAIFGKEFAMAVAMSAARCGSGSVAEMSISTVSVGTVAVTLPDSDPAVVSNRSAMGPSTRSLSISCT